MGWAPIGLVDAAHPSERLIVLLAAYGIAAGAVAAFSAYLPAFWCLFLPATIPGAIDNLSNGGGDHLTMGLLASTFVVAMGALGRRTNAEFNESLRLRFEVAALADAFRRQKELAEAANLAKSRFLAAASHDLRQPVHALSLTVGALQLMDMTPGIRTMVGHIESSVATLDGLFTSLLDISRLDAAAVKPDIDDFAIQPLLDRVCREYEREAADKGASLRLMPCKLAVRTDPVLFERILRNPDRQRGASWRERTGAGGLPPGRWRRQGRDMGYRARYSRGAAGTRVRRILPARKPGTPVGRWPRPRPGDRAAADAAARDRHVDAIDRGQRNPLHPVGGAGRATPVPRPPNPPCGRPAPGSSWSSMTSPQ